MQVKRYHAPNVQDALRAVREDLGPDALVISTRVVAAPGPRGWFGRRVVELTAAVTRTTVPEIRQRSGAPASRDTWADEAARRLAERLTAADVARPPHHDAAAAPGPAATGDPSDRLPTAMKRLSPFTAGDRAYAPVEVFVGAPGSGKTTTLAKIAARERARTGVRLGLATTEASRLAAVEEMRLHADIIGSPLAVARSAYELQTLLETASVPVLVDTDGRATPQGTGGDVLRLVSAWPDARVHLVIAADMPLPALHAAYERYADGRPARAVVTRIDRAASIDGVASFLRERRLAVSYLCAGPRVPEDLLLMTTSGSRMRWSS